MRDRFPWWVAAVFLGALAYFAWFRHYGFQLEDEGTLLFQLDRVLRGQIPYRDFHTGYTPGYFYGLAAFLDLAGESTTSVRLLLAVINAASVALIYSLACRVSRQSIAVFVALGWLAFLPVSPGEFASFNIPYPAWFVIPCWLGLVWSLADWSASGRSWSIVRVGLLCGLAFAIKPNAGAFALAASVFSVALSARARTLADRGMIALAVVAAGAGVVLAFSGAWQVPDLIVHLVPGALLIGIVWRCVVRGHSGYQGRHDPIRAFALLAVSFALPTALWVLPTIANLGLSRFARDVLFLGSPAALVYYRGYPLPDLYAVGLVVGIVAFAVIANLIARGIIPALAVVGLLLAGLAALVAIVFVAPMPESFVASVVYQLEGAAFLLVPLAHGAGLLVLYRTRRLASLEGNDREARDRMVPVLVPVAIAMYWQVFPRADFMHLIFAVAVSLVLGAALIETVVQWLIGRRQEGWASVGPVPVGMVACLGFFLLAIKIVPPVLASARARDIDAAGIGTARAEVSLEADAGDDLAALGRALSFLAEHSQPNEPVLAFPATTGVLYAAGRVSPVPHDYWFPGRPDHEDERVMVAALRAFPPRLVVTLNDGWTFFVGAPAYYRRLRQFVVANYRLMMRTGRFDILVRNDVAAELGPAEISLPPHGSFDALAEANLPTRRQAARRWTAHLQPEDAKNARLPRDPRKAILSLRAIRDGGDMRAAAWLVAGYSSRNPRVRAEAAATMAQVTRRLAAERMRWANDFDPAVLRRYLTDCHGKVDTLAGDPDPRVRRFAGAVRLVMAAESM